MGRLYSFRKEQKSACVVVLCSVINALMFCNVNNAFVCRLQISPLMDRSVLRTDENVTESLVNLVLTQSLGSFKKERSDQALKWM